MNNIKVLVLGGSGQLGKYLTSELEKRQIEFFAPNKKLLDILQRDSIRNALVEFAPTAVVNCAAWTDVAQSEADPTIAFQINFEGVQNLALETSEFDLPLIHISTDFVFGGNESGEVEEFATRMPLNKYGESKSAGEIAALQLNAKTTVLRTSWLYGDPDRDFLGKVLLRVRGGDSIGVVVDEIGNPTWAGDLSLRIVECLLEEIPPGIYHASNSGIASRFDFAAELLRILNLDRNLIYEIRSEIKPFSLRRPNFINLSQKAWLGVGMAEMRHWKLALFDAAEKYRDWIKYD